MNKLRLTQIPFFFRGGGQWEVVTHEASVHEGQKSSLSRMVFHSSSISHLASFSKLSPHIREVEPLPPPADGPPWDNELCQSIVSWITHVMFNNLKDIVWNVELMLFISSSQNWLTLLSHDMYSFYVWPCCTKLQFSGPKYSEICLQPVRSSCVWCPLLLCNLFYDLTDNVTSLDLENAIRWGKKTTKWSFFTQNPNTAEVCLKLSTVNRRFFHWTCSTRTPFELNSKRCSRRVREVHSFMSRCHMRSCLSLNHWTVHLILL